jgi:iron complex outermembrane receptor protein
MQFTSTPVALAVAIAWSSLGQGAVAQEAADSSAVIVRATRLKEPFAASYLDAAQIAPYRATSSDSAHLLGSLPGVSVYGAGGVSSLPVIRGLADDRIRIKVDGMDLISSCANHMNAPLSYLDPTSVGSRDGVRRRDAGQCRR